MVFFAPFVGAAALLSGLATARPMPDSAIGDEVAVSAPNGIVESDTAALATQTASSYDSSSYGGSDDSSSYGSSYGDNSNYGSSSYGSSYGDNSNYGSNNYGSSSSYENTYTDSETSTANYGYGYSSSYENTYTDAETSTAEYGYGYSSSYENTYTDAETSIADYTSTAAYSYSTPSYGSGQSNWNSNGYENCVQQCMNSYGAPPATYTPTATGSYGSYGTGGATHTVIVAPTQGVLRYVPFALNASVGDTIEFMWNANNHTVTKSSELTPCNKTSDTPFASGEENKGFMFSQVVNDTNPTFFYCGTPGHCEKGMFGIINPPNAFGASTSVGESMSSLASNDSDIAAMMSYTNMQTANNEGAANWGSSIDMSSMPEWSYQYIAENTMYTRTFLAANPDTLNADGSVNLGTGAPMMIPQDITAALNNAASSSSSSSAAASSATASGSASGYSSTHTSGASSLASPRALVGVMAAVVAFFAL